MNLHRAFSSVVFTMLLVGGVAPSARASAVSDIPGVPWPGGISAATVGGTSYDQVWRIVLPVGRVAVMRLEGEDGAELGLYVFDGAASSVYAAQPIAQAARPGGNQQLRVTLPAGTYYLDVNGRNSDRAYLFTLAVVLLADDTAPELALSLPSKGNRVNDPSPTLLVDASDSLSDVTEMRWQRIGDARGWSVWQPYAREMNVSIPEDEGLYSLLVEVRNGLGLASPARRFDLVLDRTIPLAVPLTVLRSGVTSNPTPSLQVQFSEAISATSWRSGVRLFDITGGSITGTAGYDPVTLRGKFVPAQTLVLGRTYALQLGSVVDLAGNRVLPGDGWSFTYKSPTAISPTPATLKVKAGSSQVLRVNTNGVPSGAPIQLERYTTVDSDGLAWGWVRIAAGTVRNGVATLQFNPESNAKFRVTFLGDTKRQAATSKSFLLSVYPDLRISGGGSTVRVRTAGQVVTLRALTSPPGLPLSLVRYRCNATWTSCTAVESTPFVSGVDGTVVSQWTAARGYWGFRIKFTATAGLDAAKSTLLRFRVP